VIRPAERKDIPRIWELIQELAEYERLTHAVTGNVDQLERHVFDDAMAIVFVFEVNDEIVGYTLSFPIYSTFRTLPGLWLEDLYVTPSHRCKGFGKALLTHLIAYCQVKGLGRLDWSVLSWNEPSIGFYQSMGAEVMPDWRICRISFG
jgi:GNAT superfamily N-acetyltransferase